MPDGHVVSGEELFMLRGLPYRDGPVADDAAEAVGLPPIKGRTDDSHIGRVGFKISTKFRDEFVAVVEPAVPRENETSARDVWLFFATRLGGGVEGPIEKCNRTIDIAEFAVWTLGLQGFADIRKELAVDRPFVKVPNPCLHTHTVILTSTCPKL